MKKRILLLNPPGDKKYLRIYYCSQVAKADYVYQPVDLVVLAGILSKDYELEVIDAIVNNIGFKECEKKIMNMTVDVIILLTGHVSWEIDKKFIENISKKKKIRIICLGDIMYSQAEKRLKEENYIEAAILDFTSADILSYLKGNLKDITKIVYRKGEKIISPKKKAITRNYKIPTPRHDLFLNKKYRYPFVKKYPMATVLTDYSCPFNCSFCMFSTLNFKYREIDDIIKELEFIKSLGIKEIFFLDQTFGAIRKRNTELCKKMIDKKFKFSWFCFSRVDVLDYTTMKLMKQAGCHTIMFGVESSQEKTLKEYKKQYTHEQIIKAFKIASKLGIQTMGTFIFGLPEETKEDCLNTIKFAKTLGCDFASFNFATPRGNTELREKAIDMGLISKNTEIIDQSGEVITMSSKNLTENDLKKIRRKAYVTFYLRPWYIIQRIGKLRSFDELITQSRQTFAILKNILKGSG